MMRSLSCFLVGAAAVALSMPMPLRAQAVDYGTLQEMFGEAVTTSVTGKPQRASTAPASIVIITREQIAASAARSVPDLLKVYAAVDVNHWTAGQSDVAVRGGVQPYNARLLVLVNGRQVYLDHYGMTDWNLLGVPLDAIQQIELVRGPASALFGFNAASGVVNIITINPMEGRQFATTAEGGNHGYSRISGVAATPIGDKLAVKLSGGHQREDERRIPGNIGTPPRIRDVTADAVSATLVAAPDATTRAELNGGYTDNRQLEFLPSELLLAQHFRNKTAGAIVDHDTGWGSIDGQAYANWLDADYGTTGTPPGPFTQLADTWFRNRIVVFKGSSLARVSKNDTVRVGVEYRNNQLYSDALYSRRVGYEVAAANGMADLHLSDRTTLSIAGRVDHLWLGQGGVPNTPVIDAPKTYDRAFTRLSFNAALLAQIGVDGQLRVNGGRGIQSPSLIDFGLRTSLPPGAAPIAVYATGDPRIEPAIVWSGELGYAQRFGSNVRIEANGFFTRTTNAIASPGDLPQYQLVGLPALSAVTRFGNVGSFETYGASVSGSGRIVEHVGWLANYTFTHVHESLPSSGPPFAIALAPAATTPTHVVNVGVDYRGLRWFGSANARYTSATRQFAFDRSAALLLFSVHHAIGLDAKAGYHLTKHLDAYVAGENLTDAGGSSGSPIPADRRVRAGVNYTL